jgi:hypothetical protein
VRWVCPIEELEHGEEIRSLVCIHKRVLPGQGGKSEGNSERDEREKLHEIRWESQGASDCNPVQSRSTKVDSEGRKEDKCKAKRTVGIIEATEKREQHDMEAANMALADQIVDGWRFPGEAQRRKLPRCRATVHVLCHGSFMSTGPADD